MKQTLDIVIPVLNEETILAKTVKKLVTYASKNLSEYNWGILIADNGSTDTTNEICLSLSRKETKVSFIRLEQRGRGRALKQAWISSDADIVSYMDVDLSTDLPALPVAITAIVDEGYEIAIGSRLKLGAQVTGRSFMREFISRAYSLLFRSMFRVPFLDAQCGFKLMTRKAADDLLPSVIDNGWFFDTEMLLIAAKCDYRIKEIPVKWTDNPDSRVRILNTAYEDMKGLFRLRFWGLKRAYHAVSRNL